MLEQMFFSGFLPIIKTILNPYFPAAAEEPGGRATAENLSDGQRNRPPYGGLHKSLPFMFPRRSGFFLFLFKIRLVKELFSTDPGFLL